jgi:predicted DNA-binding transcriptional regulator AlpA
MKSSRKPDEKSAAIEPRLLTLHQVAEILGVGYWTAREIVARGDIPKVELPQRHGLGVSPRVRVNRVDLDAYIRDHTRRNTE